MFIFAQRQLAQSRDAVRFFGGRHGRVPAVPDDVQPPDSLPNVRLHHFLYLSGNIIQVEKDRSDGLWFHLEQ